MAVVDKNIVITGLSGSLGDQLVIQEGKGGQTIVRTKPRPSDRPATEAQVAQREKFRDASAYAKEAVPLQPVYAEKAAGEPVTAYNVALADFLHPPEIVELDVTAYTGQVGQTIRVKARDDVQIKTVNVVIAAGDGTLIESGAAAEIEGQAGWWGYQTTQVAAGNGVKVIAVAQDLPGHEARREAMK